MPHYDTPQRYAPATSTDGINVTEGLEHLFFARLLLFDHVLDIDRVRRQYEAYYAKGSVVEYAHWIVIMWCKSGEMEMNIWTILDLNEQT